ncbi:hypothetical protein ACFYOT_25715 [Saccharothrix saharensis]|uniref:hypothetical protein n=1 Tax=Saccharothrix saharensis TaxID=571190 RepID=UPI0036AC92EB
MDLTSLFLRLTPVRPFLVTAPGGDRVRFAVERHLRERGWWSAASPAEANLLVLAGPEHDGLAPYLDRVWEAMPAPRARAQVRHPAEVGDVIAEAVTDLRASGRQRVAAADRPASGGDEADAPMSCGAAMPDPGHEGHHGDHDDHGQSGDQSNHGGHDMSGMRLAGLAMADRAADRDGLKLDQLHVALGPALPDWPAGLVVRLTLQGDVVQEAEVELIVSPHRGSWRSEVPKADLVHRLDNAARLLSVAGWVDGAAAARRLRDSAVAGAGTPGLEKWAGRVRRSRTLRWSLAGVGEHSGGDALTRLLGWLEGKDTALTVNDLHDLLVGAELATARLVVASAGIDFDSPVGAHG